MPSINLIQDSAEESREEKKKKTPQRIDYTQPPAEPEKKKETKLPKGSGSGFFNRLFRRQSRPESIPEKTGSFLQPEINRESQPGDDKPIRPTFKSRPENDIKMNKNNSRVLEEKVSKKTKEAKTKGPVIPPTSEQSFLDVNLMPGDLIEGLEPKKKLITYGIVIAASILIVVGGYFGLSYYENYIYNEAADVTRQIQDVEVKISDLRPEQEAALLLKSQTDQVKDMLDKHIYWSNLFKFLERYTLNNVAYEGFDGTFSRGTNPTFTLTAVTKDFLSLSRQLMAFRDDAIDYVADVEVNTGQRIIPSEGDEYVTFTVKLTIFEDLFYNKLEDQLEE